MAEEDVLIFMAKNGETVTLRLAGCQDAEEIISVIKTNAPDRSYVLMEHYGTKSESVKKYICSMDFEKNLLIVAATDRAVVGRFVRHPDGSRQEPADSAYSEHRAPYHTSISRPRNRLADAGLCY